MLNARHLRTILLIVCSLSSLRKERGQKSKVDSANEKVTLNHSCHVTPNALMLQGRSLNSSIICKAIPENK